MFILISWSEIGPNCLLNDSIIIFIAVQFGVLGKVLSRFTIFFLDLFDILKYSEKSTTITSVFGPFTEPGNETYYKKVFSIHTSESIDLVYSFTYVGYSFPLMYFTITIPAFRIKRLELLHGTFKTLVSYRYDENRYEMIPLVVNKTIGVSKYIINSIY